MTSTDPFATVVPFEVPEQVRAFAEKGVSQARDNYTKFKTAAETGNSAIEAVFSTAAKGANEYAAKVMDIVKTNTHASFDFAQELATVSSPSQFMEVWTSHARKQVEILTAQTKDLTDLARKIASESAEPVKTAASRLSQPLA